MASFKNLCRDEIPSASLITQFGVLKGENKSTFWGGENWCTAFAPNESYFAWSCGNSIVTLIPWNYCKSNLFCHTTISSPAKTGFKISVDKSDEVCHYFGHKAISIKTQYSVRSVAFGLLKSDYATSSKAFWTRRSSSKDLFLVTGHNNGHIRIWDVLTGKLLLELLDHLDLVSHLSFCSRGNLLLASSSYDGTLKIWDLLDDGNLLKTFKMNGKPVYSCCWSPDAKSLVSVGMSKSAFVWDILTCDVKYELKGHRHDIVAASYSPDSCLIATASWDTQVILWDTLSGKMIKSFNHQHPSPRLIYACGENGTWIRGVSFSSDGGHIATVADDGFLRFWNILSEENPESVATVEGSLCCSYAPSGGIVAVGCRDGSVSFWCSSASGVQSLQFLTRVAVRCNFDEEIIGDLGLPKRLVQYLKYQELV